MRVGLISDTHVPIEAKVLPDEVFWAFAGVDLILHAGDIYVASVLDSLERIAPVLAAEGDDDYGDIRHDPRVKAKHVLELEGHTIWLVHEGPYPYVIPSWQALNLRGSHQGEPPDIIVFGHQHSVTVRRNGDILVVNSGSPTFLHYRRGLGTVGILEIEPGRAEAHIIELGQPPSR